jgi:hypothetical protein
LQFQQNRYLTFKRIDYTYLEKYLHSRGMNFTDMISLRWNDIFDDRIYYTCSKTKDNFQVKIIEPIQDILDFYKECPSNINYIEATTLLSDCL